MGAPSSLAVSGRWQVDVLQAALDGMRSGVSLELRAEVDSTNTQLLDRARGGDTRTVLLLAERQTAGRGRMGRAWWSATDASGDARGPSSLTFSLGLALAPRAWSGLSLAVGVALAEALDPRGEHSVRLKWPNDLWLVDAAGSAGRKFAGVLIETIAHPAAPEGRYAVIGIGLNLDAPSADADIDAPTAGWREAEPEADAFTVLARLAPALLKAIARFETEGFAAFSGPYAERDALAGRRVTVSTTPPLAGRADGVDASGALRLATDAGLRLVDSAEVSVRPC
jgi:BirA family biotin operon repressor/biotin-[acetyl-CoA-carboxylase] ligase